MKKLLFATVFASTAIASSMGCNADSLTGLHFGLGVSVLFDKYEADVTVSTIAPYMNTVAITNAGKSATVGDVVKEIVKKSPYIAAVQSSDATDALTQATKAILGQTFGTHISTNFTFHKPGMAAFCRDRLFKERRTNCGGEVKLAYFHDFGNHLMIGVDLTGVIASKNKKTITVAPEAPVYTGSLNVYKDYNPLLNGADDNKPIDNVTVSQEGVLSDTGASLLFSEDDIVSIGAPLANWQNNSNYKNVIDLASIDNNGTGGHDELALGTTIINNVSGTTYTPIPDSAELTFEKGVFNPRLAFIIGGTVYGWFAGIRLGMSYTTGKIRAVGGKTTQQAEQSKTVSISSPLIGLHLMKQMKIAGNNDAHLYLTADWNIGDGRRTVDINGVKSFRQTGYNISAGLTWRFKLGN